ncbi:MAG: AmmeMemoRadiSam system protein B [Candidatus Bathyarchaeia archaeon]
MKTRPPCVADAFYAGTKPALTRQIAECFTHKFGPGQIPKVDLKGQRKIVGIVSPHAGYMYSGPVAANGYGKMALDGVPEVVMILGPNHTGYGSGVSILTEGKWETPLGSLEIDNHLAKQVQRSSEIMDVDEVAHRYEHSIEVQLPFLQFLYNTSVKFVPICMMMQDLQTSREIATTIIDQIKEKNCLIIASSDFTHYKPHDEAVRSDQTAIDAIMNLDDSKLNELGDSNKVTMCGYGPITVLLAAARKMSNVKTEFLTYKTSGDITGDKTSVVGYGSIIITRQ